MAVGVEYISDVLKSADTGPRTATAFLEGQKAAADIALNQQQQDAYAQALRFAEMQQPYRMAALQRQEEQGAENWRREQEAYRLDQEARLRNPQLAPPGMGPLPSGGAYAMPTLQVGAPTDTTSTGAPPGLIQAESGGRTDIINQYGYGGRLQFGQDRLNDAIIAGVAPQGTTVQAFAQNPQLQQQVEAWHFNDINNYIQSQGLGKYVGQTVGGTVITPQGMVAAAHLGGKAGLKQFLESGGRYDPADQLGTTLSSYMSRFGGVTAPSYVPSMANVPMPGQGYGAPLSLGAIGSPQVGAIPSFAGLPVSTGGVPMTAATAAEPQYATGSAETDTYAKYLLGRGLVAAGYDMAGRGAPAPAVPSGPLPTQSLLPSQPLAAPTAPTAPTAAAPTAAQPSASIFQRPGLQTGESATPFSLKTLGDITASEDAMRRKAAALDTNYRIAQTRGDYAATAAIRAEFSNLQTEGEALRRLKAVQSFEMGDPRDMQYQIYEMSKGRLKLQPRSDGKYNLLLDGKVNREGISRDQLSAEMRASFDSEFKAIVAEQRKLQIELQKETAKAGIDVYKETKKQSVQQIRELTNKLAELEFKQRNPRVKLEKTEDGFIEYDEAGNIRSFVTTQPEIGVDGKPVLLNPLDPKSGPRYRVLRTPYTGTVPTR